MALQLEDQRTARLSPCAYHRGMRRHPPAEPQYQSRDSGARLRARAPVWLPRLPRGICCDATTSSSTPTRARRRARQRNRAARPTLSRCAAVASAERKSANGSSGQPYPLWTPRSRRVSHRWLVRTNRSRPACTASERPFRAASRKGAGNPSGGSWSAIVRRASSFS